MTDDGIKFPVTGEALPKARAKRNARDRDSRVFKRLRRLKIALEFCDPEHREEIERLIKELE